MNRFEHAAVHRSKLWKFNRSSFRASLGSQSYRNTNVEFQLQSSPQNSSKNVFDTTFQLPNTNSDDEQYGISDPTQDASNSTPSKVMKRMLLKRVVKGRHTSYQIIPLQMYPEDNSESTWENVEAPMNQSKVATQKGSSVVPAPVPARRRTAPVNLAHIARNVRISKDIQKKQYRERVIHLLAIKDYKKHELLTRLQRDGWRKCDRFSLGKILEQVANLKTSNHSYSLKDCIFKEIKKDWPGYNDYDRQVLDLVLSSKPKLELKDVETDQIDSLVVCNSEYDLPHYDLLPVPPPMILADTDGPLTDAESSLNFLPYSSDQAGYIPLSMFTPHHSISNDSLTENSINSSNTPERLDTEEHSFVRENSDSSDSEKEINLY